MRCVTLTFVSIQEQQIVPGTKACNMDTPAFSFDSVLFCMVEMCSAQRNSCRIMLFCTRLWIVPSLEMFLQSDSGTNSSTALSGATCCDLPRSATLATSLSPTSSGTPYLLRQALLNPLSASYSQALNPLLQYQGSSTSRLVHLSTQLWIYHSPG